MRYLLLSVLVVSLIGILIIPNAFAEITITDDATGGDCASIGTWDSASRTCTFTSDLSEQVTVGANYITLDGNGHTLDRLPETDCSTSVPDRYGIHFNARTTLVIKNFIIKNFCDGMNFTNSINNSILDNTITNNYGDGIYIANSNNNIIVQVL